MNHYSYCKQLLSHPGSRSYYQTLFLAEPLKTQLIAALACSHLVTQIPRTVSEHSVATQKLQWWQQQSERLKHGPASHPALMAIQESATPVEGFNTLLSSVQQELAYVGLETEADFFRIAESRYLWLYHILEPNSDSSHDSDTTTLRNTLCTTLYAFELLDNFVNDFSLKVIYLPNPLLKEKPFGLNKPIDADQVARFVQCLRQLVEPALRGADEALTPQHMTSPFGLFTKLSVRFLSQELRALEKKPALLLSKRTILMPLVMLWLSFRCRG